MSEQLEPESERRSSTLWVEAGSSSQSGRRDMSEWRWTIPRGKESAPVAAFLILAVPQRMRLRLGIALFSCVAEAKPALPRST